MQAIAIKNQVVEQSSDLVNPILLNRVVDNTFNEAKTALQVKTRNYRLFLKQKAKEEFDRVQFALLNYNIVNSKLRDLLREEEKQWIW